MNEEGDLRTAPATPGLLINKPAAQATGADPSRCNSTSRQSPPFQQNRRNSWTSSVIVMIFKI